MHIYSAAFFNWEFQEKFFKEALNPLKPPSTKFAIHPDIHFQQNKKSVF